MPNLNGALGSNPDLPSLVQIAANTGASVMMKNGLTDWNTEAGIVQPNTTRSTDWSV